MEEATEAEAFSARSWLFAPGDSERKMEKAAAGPADIVILDLEELPYLDSLGLGELVECQLLAGCSARKLR